MTTAMAAALHALRCGARDLLTADEQLGVIDFTHSDLGPGDSEALPSWLAHEVDQQGVGRRQTPRYTARKAGC